MTITLSNDELETWALGVLSLAASGAAHEVDRDEELCALADGVEQADLDGPDALIIKTGGRTLRVRLVFEEIEG